MIERKLHVTNRSASCRPWRTTPGHPAPRQAPGTRVRMDLSRLQERPSRHEDTQLDGVTAEVGRSWHGKSAHRAPGRKGQLWLRWLHGAPAGTCAEAHPGSPTELGVRHDGPGALPGALSPKHPFLHFVLRTKPSAHPVEARERRLS